LTVRNVPSVFIVLLLNGEQVWIRALPETSLSIKLYFSSSMHVILRSSTTKKFISRKDRKEDGNGSEGAA
jgi:hypothetical protein